MKDKKTIKVNSNLIKSIIFGLILGFITVFIVDHFGNWGYIADTSGIRNNSDKVSFSIPVKGTTPVSIISYKTPFESELIIDGGSWEVSDVASKSYGSFYSYDITGKYYFDATIKDFKYILYIGMGYSILIFIILNYNIKLS
jgi:hypothetical protein